MAAKAFVDTNILLRAFHDTFPEHGRVRALFDRMLEEECELWISRQVIREYLVQTTHPLTFTEPLSIEMITGQLESITKICPVADDTDQVTAQLLALIAHYPIRGKQMHDANIVATMLAYNITTLLTLNTADFQRFADRITLVAPEEEQS